jgi:hypothetical protein
MLSSWLFVGNYLTFQKSHQRPLINKSGQSETSELLMQEDAKNDEVITIKNHALSASFIGRKKPLWKFLNKHFFLYKHIQYHQNN